MWRALVAGGLVVVCNVKRTGYRIHVVLRSAVQISNRTGMPVVLTLHEHAGPGREPRGDQELTLQCDEVQAVPLRFLDGQEHHTLHLALHLPITRPPSRACPELSMGS